MKLKILLAAIAAPVLALAAPPAGYYDDCDGRCGQALLTALYATVGPHTAVSYNGLPDLYKRTDVRPDGTIWDMYATTRFSPDRNKCGSYSKVGDCWNREHSFPKSWFDDHSPMVSDAFHVYPTDGKVNGQRSNYPYGECASGTTLPSNGTVKALGRLGASTTPGYSGTVFEPDDEYKGDFARTYFYMAAAYNTQIAGWHSDMLAGNAYPAFKPWAVDLLLKWHRQDPVSSKETARNEAVSAAQHNRNPFIDHPELAEHIWGDAKTEAWHSADTREPRIIQPAAGAALDLGSTVVSAPRTANITVRCANVSQAVTLSLTGSDYFAVSPSQLSASSVCAADGAVVSVTYNPKAQGSHSATLTVRAGSLSQSVALSGRAITTLPVGKVNEVSDDSFTAVWTNVGDADAQGCYTLDVKHEGASVPGFPRAVKAADERFTVSGLEPSTKYTYTIASQHLVSESVEVVTLAPIPSVEFLFDGDLAFVTVAQTPSEAAELLVDIRNIDSDVTLSVPVPFELSTDKSLWSASKILDPEEDRVYLRLGATMPGTFYGSITVTAGGYRSDEVSFTGVVTSTDGFFEDFEADPTGMSSYSPGPYQGTGALWQFTNAGMWPTQDRGHDSDACVRLGSQTNSVISMQEDYPGGIGLTRVWMRVFGSDAPATIHLETSTDGGQTWLPAGSAEIASTQWQQYTFTASAAGPARLRLRQSAGKRVLIDDIQSSQFSGLVPAEAAERHTWDAYPAQDGLFIEVIEPQTVAVYALDGSELVCARFDVGKHFVTADAGLYIVTAGDHARRVLVK